MQNKLLAVAARLSDADLLRRVVGELAFGSKVPGVGVEPAGRKQRVRVPAEFRTEAIRPNSPRGELDTS